MKCPHCGKEVDDRERQLRIGYYRETMPALWRKFQIETRGMMLDECWEAPSGGERTELGDFCQKAFLMSEARLRAIVFDSPYQEKETELRPKPGWMRKLDRQKGKAIKGK